MTEFQKEIGCICVLLVFFLGCFCYVGIVHTEAAAIRRSPEALRMITDENPKIESVSDCFLH